MFGAVIRTGKASGISTLRVNDLDICRLELKGNKFSGRWFKKLGRMGVTRIAISRENADAFADKIRRYCLQPVSGADALERLIPYIGLTAAHDVGMQPDKMAVEIYTGGNGALRALRLCGKQVRFVSCIGRGAESLCRMVYDELGISAMQSRIPKALCENVLRLYFDGSHRVMSIERADGVEMYFAGADFLLPAEYDGLYDEHSALALAELLLEYGKIRECDVKISNIIYL